MSVLLALALAANPIPALNTLEADNDRVEAAFDALCGALKDGRRDGPFPVQGLPWVTSCSLRALTLGPITRGTQTAHVLWEVEGRGPSGERTSERGEADVTLARTTGVVVTSWADTWRETVRRERPRFVERAEAAGVVLPRLDVVRRTEAESYSGGLAALDVTRDGVPELFALDANVVYRFDRISAAPLRYQRSVLFSLPKATLATGLAGGDLDRDGDVDLLVTGYPAVVPVVLRNDGASFTPTPLPPAARGGFVSAVLSDLDDDGDLDVALLPYDLGAGFPWDMLEAPDGERLRLLRGGPGVTFTPWRLDPRVVPGRWTLAAVSADLLGLNRPQLYVANDFGSNDLYVFTADGGVTNQALALGLDDPGNGMSADVGDFDGDGRLDVAVANMFSKAGTRVVGAAQVSAALKARLEKFARGNTLYLARDGGFTEVAAAQGVNRGLWAFGTVLADVNDDGRLDVAVANGFLSKPNRKDL
ncbi:MAG: VCBS repeat-containing protein [Myxococcaceae bacterium]|jgi:hypothetical protein|nr:VCBS repeat-containing protein [Myxococcaceae bacterium]